MLRVGVTGGIGSGKSTVSRRLGELGAHVVDADAVAREVVEPGEPTLQRIRERFGDSVIRADGSLDRASLAAAPARASMFHTSRGAPAAFATRRQTSVNLRCLYGTPVRSLTIMGPTRRSIGIRPISSITIGCSNRSCSTGTPRLLGFFRRMPLASISDHISPVVQRVPRWRMPPSASGAGSIRRRRPFGGVTIRTATRSRNRPIPGPPLRAASRIACTCSSVSFCARAGGDAKR